MGGNRAWLVGTLAAVAMVVSACGSKPAAPAPASAPAAKAPLHIADISSVTGAAAQYGEQIRAGEDLAVAEINKAGGIGGRQVQLEHKDNATDKAQAIALFRQFASNQDVLAILGPNASPDAVAATPLATEFKVNMVVTGGAIPWPTPFGQWVFRVPVTNDVIINKLVSQTVKAYSIKKAAIIYAADQDYAVAAKALFTDAAQKAGVTIATVQTYRAADLDYSAQLTAIKNAGVDAVFMSSLAENAGPMIKQAKGLGLNVHWIGDAGIQNPKFWDLSQGTAAGVVTGTPFDPTSTDPAVQKFVSSFKAAKGADATLYNAYGYDSAMVVLQGLKGAGDNPTRDSLRAAMGKISGLAVSTGKVSFPDGSGNAVREGIFLVQMESGKFVAFKG